MVAPVFNNTSSPTSIIRKIAVVGAFNGFENDPESNDYKYIFPLMEYLRKSGVPVVENPDFDAINFADGRNFLDEDHQYDAVFIAHIRNGSIIPTMRGADTPVTFDGKFYVSNEFDYISNMIDPENTPQKWNDRIKQSGAKLLMSYGSGYEVNLHWLNNIDYIPAILPLVEKVCLYDQTTNISRDGVEKHYGSNLDVPYNYLGISALPSFLPSIKGGSTDLAKNIGMVMTKPLLELACSPR